MAMAMNHKIIGAEFQLPQEIIQHIQSYMSGREAAQTTLLNKSWHRAWLTRPNLNFDLQEFQRGMIEFEEFTKKTIQRYEDLKLKINSLKLRIEMYMNLSIAPELISKAIKFGAELISKAIELGATDLDIQFWNSLTNPFVLPDEVLQSKTLTRLSVSGCTIDLERIIGKKKEVIITFPNLKLLDLSQVYVTGDLISRCPSIEELRLEFLTHPPFDVAKLIKLHNLKYLRLGGLDTGDSLSKSDLWPKFACLKELEIMYSSECEPTAARICSTSLERITISSLNKNRIVDVEFNVPNIKNCEFYGHDLPCLGKSSREWEADVMICCHLHRKVSASWFSSLNQLAKMLGRSQVSLFIFLGCDQGDGYEYTGDGLAIPAVENLMIVGSYTMSNAFLDALFCSCRPNLVILQSRCVVGFDRANTEEFPLMRSSQWEELLDAKTTVAGIVYFRLK